MRADQGRFAVWLWRAGRLLYFWRLRVPDVVLLNPDAEAAWRFRTAEAAWSFIDRDPELSGKARERERGVAEVGARDERRGARLCRR
jgi:hypothetical protein